MTSRAFVHGERFRMNGYCSGYGRRLAHLLRSSLAKHGDRAFSGEVFVLMKKEMLL